MKYNNIIFETRDHIATITLSHPPVNAWNWDMMVEFEAAEIFELGYWVTLMLRRLNRG